MANRKPGAATKPQTRPQAPSLNQPARASVSKDELRKLISEAAYFRAQSRGFKPGHELEDWIQAEAEVMGEMKGRNGDRAHR